MQLVKKQRAYESDTANVQRFLIRIYSLTELSLEML